MVWLCCLPGCCVVKSSKEESARESERVIERNGCVLILFPVAGLAFRSVPFDLLRCAVAPIRARPYARVYVGVCVCVYQVVCVWRRATFGL